MLGTVFFPENSLTRVKMKGLEPLNEKGQEAGRMSEEVPSKFLIWELFWKQLKVAAKFGDRN